LIIIYVYINESHADETPRWEQASRGGLLFLPLLVNMIFMLIYNLYLLLERLVSLVGNRNKETLTPARRTKPWS